MADTDEGPERGSSKRDDDAPASSSASSRGRPMATHLAALGAGVSATSIAVFSGSLLAALAVHGFIAATAASMPEPKREERVAMAIVKVPPPPPPKVEEPPPPKEEPPPPPKEEPKPKPKPKTPPPPAKKPTPPPPQDAPPPPSNDTPPPEAPPEPVPLVVGVNLNSVVKSGNSGMKVAVGNTTYGNPDDQAHVPAENVRPYRGGDPGWQPARAATVTREPREKKKVRARYPAQLRDEGIEGDIHLRVEIRKDGTTRSVKVIRGVHPLLDKLALQAVKRFLWHPAEVDGEAVDYTLTYRYAFELLD